MTDDVQEVTEPSTENTENNQMVSEEIGETESGEDATGETGETENGENATGETEGTDTEENVTGETGETESGEDATGETEGTDAEEDVSGVKEDTDTEEVAVEEKNVNQPVEERNVQTTSGTVLGSFSDVSIVSQGFNVDVTGTFTLDAGVETNESAPIYLVQYDENDTRLYSSYISDANAENSVVSIDKSSIPVHEDTAYFRLEAKSSLYEDLVICSDNVTRTNKPEVTFKVEKVLEGGTLGFQISYTGDMQYGEDQDSESFYVELFGGISEDTSTWQSLKQSSIGFSKNATSLPIVNFTGLEAKKYYGKLVFYNEFIDEGTETYERIRLYEQEVELEPFTVTESFGYFEDVKMTFGGMGVKTEYTFNYTGYQSDETVTLYLVQSDEAGNELYSYKINNEYSGIYAWINTYSGGSIWTHKDAVSFRMEARGKEKVVVSEDIIRSEIPEISFSIDTENTTIEQTKAIYRVGFKGNLLHETIFPYAHFKAALRGGTSEKEEEWQEIDATEQHLSFGYNDYGANEGFLYVSFEGLEPGTTYYGEIVLSAAQTKGGNQGSDFLWDAVIPVNFTTETPETVYNLSEVFTDEAFRNLVESELQSSSGYSSEDGTATAGALKSINSIISNRSDFTTAAVKDLTGLDLLTGLTSMSLKNHEIEDVSEIDWSKLSYLGYLNLNGNDITTIPDLSGNSALTSVYLADNRLSQEELAKAKDKLPAGAVLDESAKGSQRINGFEVLAEENYYFYGSSLNLYVQAKGYKSGLPYTVKFYVDDKEQTFETLSQYEYLYALKNADLTEGEHTLKVELCKGETGVEETITHSFNAVKQDIFAEKNPYYIDSDTSDSSDMDMDLYFPAGMEITDVEIVKDNKVYLKQSEYNSLYANPFYGADPRYQALKHLNYMAGECNLYYATAYLTPVYYTTPSGTYDLKVTFSDGSVQTVTNAVEVSNSGKVIITECRLGHSYDNTGKYIYVVLEGWNINPTELEYSIKQNENTYPVTYVNHKYTYSGMVVKLEKNGWTTLEDRTVQIAIKGADQTANILSESVNMSSGVYYAVYNKITGNIEAAFSTDTNANGKNVTVSAKTSYDGEAVATGNAVVTDGIAYFNLKNTDGSSFPSTPGYYYFDFTVDDITYNYSMDIRNIGTVNSVNYWSGRTTIYEGTDSPVMWYYSDMKYNNENAKASSYTAQITGSELTTPVTITSSEDKVKTDDVNGMVAIGMEFDESELKAGNYEITLYKDSNVVSSNQLEVKSADRFILYSLYANWNDSSSINVYINTTSDKASDTYTVSLTDINGVEVEGLKTKVTARYGSTIYLSVTGLNYKDAAKKYYIKVTNNRLGEACNSDGNSYYEDEKGSFQQLSYSLFSYYYNQNDSDRAIGISMGNAQLPITIGIYKPYQTEPIKEIRVNSKSELYNGYTYYFSKTLYDSLPDKDGIYDIVCVDNDKKVGIFEGKFIGYMEGVTTVWDYSIDKTNLYINDEENKTATVTISDNKGKPTFKSSDTSVVTIKADSENPNKAVITAVGIGMAEITITADNIAKKFVVTSNRKVTLESLELNKNEMTLGIGESQKLIAAVFPAEAWNENLVFSFTAEPQDIISMETGKDGDMVKITALRTGEAVITVVVADPEKNVEKTAQCTVTVKNIYSEEEQTALADAVGTKYVLLNTYPKMAATLADVTLPDGWTWADDSVKLTADDTAPIQYYTAEYDTEDYEPFTAVLPVAVSQLTKVSLDGDKTIVSKDTKEYQAVGKYKGYQPVADEYAEAFAYQWTAAGKTPAVVITGENAKTVSITANEVSKNTSQTVNLVVNVGGKAFKASLKMTVTTAPYVDAIHVSVSQNQLDSVVSKFEYVADAGTLTIDNSVISTVKNNVHNTLRLNAAALIEEEETILAKGFKWSSSDTSVMAVKADKGNASAVLTFKKPGSAVLHVVAQDGGKYDKEIVVTIKDYTPILEANKISLDLYSAEGAAIPVKSQNGNEITGIAIQEQASKTKEWGTSAKFEVEIADGIFYVKAANGYAPTKNENVKVQLQITTEDGETVAKAATISVNAKTKPTASVKVVSKANLFETGAGAWYKITSKYKIESIEDITVEENGSYRGRTAENGFRLTAVDVANGEFLLDTGETLSDETLADFKAKKSPLCQVTLKVSFAGYTDAADQTIAITVATEDKKPSLKLNDIILLSGMTETTTQVYDTKAKATYPVDVEKVTISSQREDVTANVTEEGRVNVAYSGTKNVSYKAEMKSVYWTQPLTLSGKITVSMPQKQNMVLDNAKIILNKGHNVQNNKVAIGVSVKNNNAEIDKVAYQIDKNNRKLFDSGYLYLKFSQENQMLYVGLNKDMGEGIKAGNYKVNLTGFITVNGMQQSLKAVALTITLADKTPTVSLKAKGSIDLVRRQDTSIAYTPTYKNVTAIAEDVKLSGAYAEYFNAIVEDGKIIVTAATDKAMSSKISYLLTLTLTLDNGCEVSSTVKIKPMNKLPKLTAKMTKATLYKANPEELSYQITTNDSKTSISRIERVEDKNSKYFNFATEGDMVNVSLTEEANKMKPGKYTVSYKVYMEGAAYNVKPTTLKLTVTVK